MIVDVKRAPPCVFHNFARFISLKRDEFSSLADDVLIITEECLTCGAERTRRTTLRELQATAARG